MNRILITVSEADYQAAMIIAAAINRREPRALAQVTPQDVLSMATALGLPQMGRAPVAQEAA